MWESNRQKEEVLGVWERSLENRNSRPVDGITFDSGRKVWFMSDYGSGG